jgi:hypothetical protein
MDCTNSNISLALGTAVDTDAALRHLWAVHFRLGRFDPLEASAYNALGWESMGTTSHQQLALEAAQQGCVLLPDSAACCCTALTGGASVRRRMVLLKNADATLPISRSAQKRMRIVLVGPTLEIRSGGYSGRGTGGPFTGSTATYVSRYAKTSVVAGCPSVSCTDDSGIAAAVAAAATADVVLVAIGISSDGDPGCDICSPPCTVGYGRYMTHFTCHTRIASVHVHHKLNSSTVPTVVFNRQCFQAAASGFSTGSSRSTVQGG